ncbi:MAG: CoA pyrophosphatase [Alphaproteobacteria bacterium]|nr:CoA pyrophosphatase [Alphaproteobacteria bacterium]
MFPGTPGTDDPLLQPPVASAAAERGDHDLNPGMQPRRPMRQAAVLVPIVARPEALTVLLTRRTDTLQHHAGQISFPGGRAEPDDADARATALRETREEIGLAPERVSILGRLDTYLTRTGFEIVPVVGLVEPPFDLAPDATEVAEVFEVPLAFILDRENRQRGTLTYEGAERHFWQFPFGRHRIWGVTAGMLVNLSEILAPP